MKRLAVALLLCASSAFASVEDSPETFAVCKTVDIASTAYLLKTGVATEGNPFMAPLVANGFAPLIALSVAIYWALKYANNPTSTEIANGVTCGVAAHNLLMMP